MNTNLTPSMGFGAVASAARRERAPKVDVGRSRYLESNRLAGYGSVLATLKFAAWAHEQHVFPTPEAVMEQFGVGRATAYRWCSALAEAYGFRLARRGNDTDRRMRLIRDEA